MYVPSVFTSALNWLFLVKTFAWNDCRILRKYSPSQNKNLWTRSTCFNSHGWIHSAHLYSTRQMNNYRQHDTYEMQYIIQIIQCRLNEDWKYVSPKLYVNYLTYIIEQLWWLFCHQKWNVICKMWTSIWCLR